MTDLASNGLPPTWATAKIGDLIGCSGLFVDGDWVESKDQDPEGDLRLVQLADVGDGRYLDKSARFLTSKKARELRCTHLHRGDVLIARMPDPLGRACIFPGDPKPCVTAVDVCIVRTGSTQVNHQWLMWFVNSPVFRSRVAELQSGSTRKRISRKNLSTITLPVPPLREQVRIASAIDEQLSRLDAGVAALTRVEANLKRYKAAVLKAAVEGKLTEKWRAEHPVVEPASELLKRILKERRRRWEQAELAKMTAKGKPPTDDRWKKKYREPIAPNTDALPPLPTGWTWATIDQLAALVTKGSSPGWQGYDYVTDGILFLRSQNVRFGRLDFDDKVFLPVSFNDTHQNSIMRTGDVLLNLVGASVGRSAIASEELNGANTNQAVGIIQMVPGGMHNRFLMWYLLSPAGQRHIHGTKADVARANFNLDDVRSTPVPLPPPGEQLEIVEAVEAAWSLAEGQEATVGHTGRRASRLRQSILKRAFEGKLVPQDPTDEPASVLLDRIRAERAATTPRPSLSRLRDQADSRKKRRKKRLTGA